MNRKYLAFLLFVIVLVLIAACAPAQQVSTPALKPEAKVEANKSQEPAVTEQKSEISADVRELLDKPKTRIKSIYYKYRGPETGNNFYEFYVKGDKIKYKPARELQSLDQPNSYDSIFIDKTAKTAQSYCLEPYCKYKGKKEDLNYDDAYMPTILDWVSGLTQAIKIGEEVIDERNTWKIETSKGILWVDTFYGVPLKVDSSGKIYRFQQISVNSVQDADVVP